MNSDPAKGNWTKLKNFTHSSPYITKDVFREYKLRHNPIGASLEGWAEPTPAYGLNQLGQTVLRIGDLEDPSVANWERIDDLIESNIS
jgi:hypothetical protein